MTIVAALTLNLATRLFRRWRGAAAAVVTLAAYTLLVGSQPAVKRAAVFGVLAVLGKQTGRSRAA